MSTNPDQQAPALQPGLALTAKIQISSIPTHNLLWKVLCKPKGQIFLTAILRNKQLAPLGSFSLQRESPQVSPHPNFPPSWEDIFCTSPLW